MTLILPALNEEPNIPWVLGRLPDLVDEVILVDGHSTDNTVDLAKHLRPAILVLHQDARGKGDAVIAGMAAATGDVVVMMDLDGSMDPAEIPLLVACLVAGADVVKGSRRLAGGGSDDITWLRRWGNNALRLLANAIHGGSWSEMCFGYAGFWRDRLPLLDLDSFVVPREGTDGRIAYGHGFEIEAVLFCRAQRAGLRVAEVPSHEYRRRHGASKLVAFHDGLRVARAIIRETRWRPSR